MAFREHLDHGRSRLRGLEPRVAFQEAFPEVAVTAFDNLHRRGSELNLPRLQEAGVHFRHGDIRCTRDLEQLPDFDLLIDCAAEPSVQAGVEESPRYVLNNNLVGTINCLEAARRTNSGRFVLLSTSRVYPIDGPESLCRSTKTRPAFAGTTSEPSPGFSDHGVAEDVPAGRGTVVLRRQQAGQRITAAGIRLRLRHAGRDQSLRHPRRTVADGQSRPGGYHALGGAPLFRPAACATPALAARASKSATCCTWTTCSTCSSLQLESPAVWDGRVYNVGGGNARSVSLQELTEFCVAETGQRVPIAPVPETQQRRSSHLHVRLPQGRGRSRLAADANSARDRPRHSGIGSKPTMTNSRTILGHPD